MMGFVVAAPGVTLCKATSVFRAASITFAATLPVLAANNADFALQASSATSATIVWHLPKDEYWRGPRKLSSDLKRNAGGHSPAQPFRALRRRRSNRASRR